MEVWRETLWENSIIDTSDHHKQLVIPLKYIPNLLQVAHDSVFGAHQGIKRTYQRIAAIYSAPKLKKYCVQHVKTCKICQKRAGMRKADRFPLQPIQIRGMPIWAPIYRCVWAGNAKNYSRKPFHTNSCLQRDKISARSANKKSSPKLLQMSYCGCLVLSGFQNL